MRFLEKMYFNVIFPKKGSQKKYRRRFKTRKVDKFLLWRANSFLIILLVIAIFLKNALANETKNETKTDTVLAQEQNSGKKSAETTQTGLDFSYKTPELEEMPNATWLLVKTLAILGLVLGGFFLIFRLVIKKSGQGVFGQSIVQVLANVPIAQGRFLQIVDIMGAIYVLGITEQNISLITEIQDKELVKQVKLQSSRSISAIDKNSFANLLQKFITPSEPIQDNNDENGNAWRIAKTLKKSYKQQTNKRHIVSQSEEEPRIINQFMAKHRQRLQDLNKKVDQI